MPSYGPPGVCGQLNNVAVPGLAEVMGPLPSLEVVKSAAKGSFSPSQVIVLALDHDCFVHGGVGAISQLVAVHDSLHRFIWDG